MKKIIKMEKIMIKKTMKLFPFLRLPKKGFRSKEKVPSGG